MTSPVTPRAEQSTLVRHVVPGRQANAHHLRLNHEELGPFDRYILTHTLTTFRQEIRLGQKPNRSDSSSSYAFHQSGHKFLIDIEAGWHYTAMNFDVGSTKYDCHQG